MDYLAIYREAKQDPTHPLHYTTYDEIVELYKGYDAWCKEQEVNPSERWYSEMIEDMIIEKILYSEDEDIDEDD